MAGTKRDRETFAAEDYHHDSGCDTTDPPMMNAIDPSSPPKKPISRDGKFQRPPSLAATHPASYFQHTQHVQQNMPSSPAQKRIKLEPTVKLEQETAPKDRQHQPLCQQIHDPKFLTSREPAADHPMYRHLRSDTAPDQPSVISPTFMIALPLGTLIEAANYYPAMKHQPRDPQIA